MAAADGDSRGTHSSLERVLRGLAGALAAIGAAALAGIFFVVLAAVVMRYGWSRPWPFTEELSGLFMTVAVFTLLPVTVLRELNIRVTVASDRLSGRPKRLVFVFGQLVLVAFCAVFAWEAWGISTFTHNLNLKSEQSRLPLAPFLFASTSAMALAGVIGAWRALRPVKPEVEDTVHA
jgi:TRAP-type C4-dicarboxylate transport system permease small subunit